MEVNKEEIMPWKYALVKVGTEEWPEIDVAEPICMLCEIYDLTGNGKFTAHCSARIQTPGDLKRAYDDVQRDGINEWFYNNGTFTYDHKTGHWNYKYNDDVEIEEDL